MGLFAGIDESNNSQRYNLDEIYVVSLSESPQTAQVSRSRRLGKKTGLYPNFLQEGDFFYIGITPEQRSSVCSYRLILTSVISEFLEVSGKLEKLVIDGLRDNVVLDAVAMVVGMQNMPDSIAWVPKGDRKYAVVNRADEIAYEIHKMQLDGEVDPRLRNYKLHPDLERYGEILTKEGVIF